MSDVCPKCQSTEVSLLKRPTSLGYQRFRCKRCRCIFNERSGTVFNFLEYPTDLVLMVVRWRLRYCLSLRNLSEMMLERGFEFTHEAVRSWEERYAPLITQLLRRRRKGRLGKSWYVDETYIKSLESASRFCRAHDELRRYYKAGKGGEKVSLKQQRISYLKKSLDLTYSVRLSS